MAESLGYDRKAVFDVGPAPWITALQSADDTLGGERRQVFLAFLMALALSNPSPGSELIFERAFEPLHSALATSRLSDQAYALLIRSLPSVSWWQQWDSCLRLCVGVVRSYQSQHLDENSFKRLTSDRALMNQIDSIRREKQREWDPFD